MSGSSIRNIQKSRENISVWLRLLLWQQFCLKIANFTKKKLSNQTVFRNGVNGDSSIWTRLIYNPNYNSEATIDVHLDTSKFTFLMFRAPREIKCKSAARSLLVIEAATAAAVARLSHGSKISTKLLWHPKVTLPHYCRKNTTKFQIRDTLLLLSFKKLQPQGSGI